MIVGRFSYEAMCWMSYDKLHDTQPTIFLNPPGEVGPQSKLSPFPLFKVQTPVCPRHPLFFYVTGEVGTLRSFYGSQISYRFVSNTFMLCTRI